MALAYSREYVTGIQLETVNGGDWQYDEEVGYMVFVADNPDLPPNGYMNAYEVNLGYGGAEEGGWWFDVREPLSSIKFRSEEEAINAFELLHNQFSEEYMDIPERHNTNGTDLVIVAEDHFARTEPQEKPRYE